MFEIRPIARLASVSSAPAVLIPQSGIPHCDAEGESNRLGDVLIDRGRGPSQQAGYTA